MSKPVSESVRKFTKQKTTIVTTSVENDPQQSLTGKTVKVGSGSGSAEESAADTKSPLISLLLNLYLSFVYGYSIYYMLFDKKGSQFNSMLETPLQKFTLFRFLTFNSLIMQLVSSLLHSATLVMPKCKPARDLVFTSFAFPLSWIVACSFWIIYITKGREYIYPVWLEVYLPIWLNHVIHTMILPANLGQAYLTRHNYLKYGAVISFGYLLAYYCYLLLIKLTSGLFPYFFMDQMCLASRVVYLGSTFFCSLVFYQLGPGISSVFHQK